MEALQMGYSSSLVKLICEMLDKDPGTRLSAATALDHAFYKEHKDGSKSTKVKNHSRSPKGSPRTGSPRTGRPRSHSPRGASPRPYGSGYASQAAEESRGLSKSPRDGRAS